MLLMLSALHNLTSRFFWAGFNALCLVWIYFRLPEPTGLSYAELDTVCLPESVWCKSQG